MTEDTLPPSAPLRGLRARVEQARRDRYDDLDVPDLDGIFVRYHAVSADTLAEKMDRTKTPDPVDRHASLLVAACTGVFERTPDGARAIAGEATIDPDGQIDGTPTVFGPELAAELAVTRESAVAVVRALYITDGDIISASDAVVELSGFGGDGRPSR